MKRKNHFKNPYYRSLIRNMLLITILVSFTPLLLTTAMLLGQFETSYHEKVLAHLKELVQKHKQNIDVVILDIKMPGMDGIEVLKQIKKDYPLVEVIMLTGHGTTETAVEGMKLGAFDYLLKPADFSDLQEKMEAAFRRKEEQQERIRKAELKLLLRKSGDI